MLDLILTVAVVAVSALAIGIAIYSIIDTRKKYNQDNIQGKRHEHD